MTFDEWHGNPDLRKSMRELLASPLGQCMMSVLESLSYVENSTNIPSNAMSEAVAVLAGRMVGYRKCQQNLLALAADPPQETKKQTIETYGVKDIHDATE